MQQELGWPTPRLRAGHTLRAAPGLPAPGLPALVTRLTPAIAGGMGLVFGLALLVAPANADAPAPAPAPASKRDTAPVTIYANGEVMTPQGWSDSFAVSNGAIVAVGSDAVAKLAGADANRVDLGGKAVMPGLYDMHVHVNWGGQDMVACKFPNGSNAATIAATIKRCAARLKPGDWVVGGSWVAAAFKPGEQNIRVLDQAAPNNPVLLNDEAGHSAWVNSRALALAGIDKTTPNPENGIIERDASGAATGLLRETATMLVEAKVPASTARQLRDNVKRATDVMLSYGIVGFTDASIRWDSVQGYTDYAREGGLKQYARGCMVWGPNSAGSETMIPQRQQYSAGRFQLDCVKMFLDGVPTEARTGAMLAPYLPRKGHDQHGMGAGDRGMLMIPQEKLNAAVADFDRQGLEVKFHAAGDAATRAAIDAIAFARKANGFGGPRHDVGHNTFVDPADVPRADRLGFTWELSPYIWYPTPIASVDIMNVVGPERMKRLWPMKDVLDTGALVVAGSDWPVVPSVNPWLGIETLVTRQVPGATGPALGEQEKITLDQALRIFTRNGAALMGRLDRGGTIEVGKLADFIVLEKNPSKVPIGEVHNTHVLQTYIAGEKVFDATLNRIGAN